MVSSTDARRGLGCDEVQAQAELIRQQADPRRPVAGPTGGPHVQPSPTSTVDADLGTRLIRRSDDGAVTAEYAVTTVAACGFAGILYEILKSDTVINLVVKVISKALGWLL